MKLYKYKILYKILLFALFKKYFSVNKTLSQLIKA